MLKINLLLSVLILGACSHPKATQQDHGKPNIIIILVDDMGYSDIGSFGGEIPTPNLDALAHNGLTMTNFYNAGRCCPTRASLLTGLYQHQAGVGGMVDPKTDSSGNVVASYQGFLNNQCVTIAEALKLQGYHTYMSGKWHVGEDESHWPAKRGFENSFAFINGATSYYNLHGYRSADQKLTLTLNDKSIEPESGFYMTDAIADHAVSFVNDAAQAPDPFFMYVAFTAPHWPLHALESDIEKFRGNYDGGWDSLRGVRYQTMIEKGIIKPEWELSGAFKMQLPEKEKFTPAYDTLNGSMLDRWRARMEVYAAMVHSMDRGVGRIVNELKKSGQLENTLIMFLSDNGASHEAIYAANLVYGNDGEVGSPDSFESYGYPWANASNTPFRLFKHWTLEGGISTPFIAHWPAKIKPVKDTTHVAHIIDLMATCVDVTGGKYPTEFNGQAVLPMEGQSLQLIFERKENPKRKLFWEHEGNWAVRDGDWKLVSTYPCAETSNQHLLELFNISEDRDESDNRLDKHPEMVAELTQAYQAWANRVGVREPLSLKRIQ